MLRLLALVALLLPLSVSAQHASSIDDPLRPDRSPLAAAAEVPAVLLLGIGGPTAAFVNPARAAYARERFVYGTIRPQTGPLSFAGLFGSRDHRWLLTADNQIFVREDTDAQAQMQTTQLPAGGMSSSESERTDEIKNITTATRARLLLVGRTDFGGYAFGLFGGYRSANFDITRASTSATVQNYPEESYSDVRRQASEQSQRRGNDDFAVGTELALAGRTWDLAASVSYQHRAADAFHLQSAELDRMFEDAFQSLTEERLDSFRGTIEGSPRAVDFEVIGALRAGRKRGDYLYGSVSGTFGGGTADYDTGSIIRRFLLREVEGEVVEDVSVDEASEDAGDIALDTRATQVSLGYVYARHGRGMTVLAAVNPTADFGRVESVSARPSNGFPVAKHVLDQASLALNLPLYLRFDVTKRLEAFGGGVYIYRYDRHERTEQPVPSPASGTDETLEVESSRTTDLFASTGRLFAGAVMTFRSGLTAQASFQGDLAQFSGWTVSIGYRF